jgi:hypothetical protein
VVFVIPLLKDIRCGVRSTGCLDRMTAKAQRRQTNKQHRTSPDALNGQITANFVWENLLGLGIFAGEIIVGGDGWMREAFWRLELIIFGFAMVGWSWWSVLNWNLS